MATNTKFNWIKKSRWKDLKDKVPLFWRRIGTKKFRKPNLLGKDLEKVKDFSDYWFQ